MTNDHEFEAVRTASHDAPLVSGLLLALALLFLAYGKRRVMHPYPAGRSNKV
jgi:4-amino-4-deoxy-L-arabinose transferase-like glycosyltransferase